MVYIPGVVLQLVDCGAQHEPCHHIALLENDSPFPPGHEDQADDELLPLTYFDIVKQRSTRTTHGKDCFDRDTKLRKVFQSLN